MRFFLLALISLQVMASGEWWTLPRSEDEQSLYYLGISEGEGELTMLQEKAFNRAMAELIREHFGMSFQMNESTVEELQNESYQVVTKQSSAPLYIKGIGVVKTHEKELDNGMRLYVQIKVKKRDLEEAIQKHQTQPGQDILNTFGESHEAMVSYKVRTRPQGALIKFSHLDKKFHLQGQGDARFFLPRGRYEMEITLPGYAQVSKQIELLADGKEELIELEELVGFIDLEVEPEGARIELEGKKIKAGQHKILVEKSYRLSVTHPDYRSIETDLFLTEHGTISRHIQLEPRSSQISYDVQPSNAKIFIDGIEKESGQEGIFLSPGAHTVLITAPGYFDYKETIELGINRVYPTKRIHMRVDYESIPPSSKGATLRFEYNPYAHLGNIGHGLLFPIALHFEYKYFSLGAGYGWLNYEKEEKDTYDIYNVEVEDFYATARIITPQLGPFKFFVSGTYGQYNKVAKDDIRGVMWQENVTYQGYGGGFRLYFTPKWSMHGEYFDVQSVRHHNEEQARESRAIAGFAFEF